MKNSRRYRPGRIAVLPLALLAILGLVVTACGDDTETADDSGSSETTAAASEATTTTVAGLDIDYASLEGTLNGSGSSFQDALEQTVKGEFEKVATGVKVNYAKSGSSAGKADLAGNTVQFAGTDSLIKDADKATFTGGEVLYFPIAAAPITVSYNLAGVEELNLSADVIAAIFQGEITSWDDAKIAADNPDAKLPATPIAVVHRSDGSGTTSNFTKYLKKATACCGVEIPTPTNTGTSVTALSRPAMSSAERAKLSRSPVIPSNPTP